MYRKVLVPLDGSELAECALSEVRTLAKDRCLGEVILLNAVGVDIPWDEMDKGIDFHAMRQKVLQASERYLVEVQSRLLSEGLQARVESLEINRPDQAIIDYVKKNGVDLIVMATHGYTGMKKMLLGSVALRVLHESPVPVLLVRPESCRV